MDGDEEKNKFMWEHDIHLRLAESAWKSLEHDQSLTLRNSDHYFAFSFDLQNALPYPKLNTSVVYYKLYVLN